MNDDQEIDHGAIAETAAKLLAEHPTASVAAIGSFSGLYCEMPADVPLNGQAVITSGRLYDLAPREFRTAVFDAWRRVRNHGVGSTRVELLDGGPATMCFLDTRQAYGVILALLIPGDHEQIGLEDLGPEAPARSRFGRFWRDDLGRVIRMDAAAEQLIGFEEAELLLQDPIPWIHPDDHELAFENFIETLASPGVPRRWRCRHLCKDGSYRWVEITNTNHLDEDDEKDRHILSEMMDISDEMAANERVREWEELLRRLAESMPLGIVQTDAAGDVVYTNARLHTIVGVPHATTLHTLFSGASIDDRPRLAGAFDRVVSTGVDVDLDVAIERHDQAQRRICQLTVRALHGGDHGVTGAVITVEDITESTMLRRELERRANIDPLTACHTRAATMSELDRLLAQRVQPDLGTGVVFVDLDKFKPINDRLGHAAGDEVLAAAADRLRRAVRAQDIVGRLGGDEFLVVCPGVNAPDVVATVAARVNRELGEPLVLSNGEPVDLSASIGVAWSVNSETTADRLVARADEAMYQAKRGGLDRPVVADQGATGGPPGDR